MKICALSGSPGKGAFMIFSTVPGTAALDFSVMASPLSSSWQSAVSAAAHPISAAHPDALPSGEGAPKIPSRAPDGVDKDFLISEMSKSGLKSSVQVVPRGRGYRIDLDNHP
jgi:hypothetical protein